MEQLTWELFPSETRDTIEGQLSAYKENNIQYVIVWFHAEWCGPCRAIEEDVRDLVDYVNQTSRIDWKWYDIMVPKDVIEKTELKEIWGFKSIPTFFVLEVNTETWNQYKWCDFQEFARFLH
jgi:thiol-disulfide isomerase/thioredoxin